MPSPETTKERAKLEVMRLVDKYNQFKESGRLKDEGENDTKKDFITPLFRALGWDMGNDYIQDEVKNEARASNGRVDYAFRLNGISKLFLEAKALNKGIGEIKDSKQAINYAWYRDVTWAVLTDFKELMIYNAEVKDKSINDARFIYLGCGQFVDKFDTLWLLSKPAFIEGLLDKEAESWGKKKRRIKPNKQLLKDITDFRDLLSKNIKKNNLSKNLTQPELEETVQKILDRLIFIRSVEDRHFEERRLLSAVREFELKKRGKLSDALKIIYRRYDEKFDSKLFTQNLSNPKERHLCEDVAIDDEVLAEIIKGLHESKDGVVTYDFELIDEDILGSMYEQYLAYVLRMTEKRARVEHNAANRKEQGIYYTPPYIVNYIIEHTLGEYLKGKSPEEVSKIRVLDPACGSGSFLTKAFKYLEKYHHEKNPEYAKAYTASRNGGLKITPQGKILQENIFGVDLDQRAVEISQLSLLISAADDKGRLPALSNNIKNGNSLIDDASVAGDKAFVWEKEFSEIMKGGGFDVVIGNPPYGAELTKTESVFLLDKYPATKNNSNTAISFINRAYSILRVGGYLGFIVPKPLFYSSKWNSCREFIKADLVAIVDVSKAFEDVLLEEVIIILKKNCNTKKYRIDFLNSSKKSIVVEKTLIELFGIILNDLSTSEFALGVKMNSGKYFSDIADIKRGVIIQNYLKSQGDVPVLRGKCIGRYLLREATEFINKSDYQTLVNQLKYMQKKKIVIQNIVAHVKNPTEHIILMATLDKSGLICLDNVGCIFIKDSDMDELFLITILNSRLMAWYAYRFIYAKAIRTMRLDKHHISKIPLCLPKSKSQLQRIIQLSQRMIELNISLSKFADKHTSESDKLEKEIQETDKKIDELVYQLYGLTKEEIKIVEESVK